MKTIGLLVAGLGLLVFYLAFWVLSPYVCSLIPITSEWKNLIDLAIYVIVGWGGGIGIPICLFICGFAISNE